MIAQGGMAEVYRAEQELTPGFTRPVALKVIRPEYAESPDFREMFLDEARTACTLSHPNIVHIYEVGEIDHQLFMAMELVTGETLAGVARRLRERGERLADEGLLAVGVFVCSALEAVHALKLPGEGHVNLVHRDVSPHNLLLDPNGSLKLIDFGIAKAAHNRNLTSPGVTKGKAGYFSPEQAMGRALDGRSDLFSVGVTLYKLAYGATPFDDYKDHFSRNTALVHGRFLPLRHVCAGLPEGLYEVVDRALDIKPENRWADARQMREALESVALECGVQLGQSSLAYYVENENEPPEYHSSPRAPAAGARGTPPTMARSKRLEPIVPHGETAKAPPPKPAPRTVLDLPAARGRNKSGEHLSEDATVGDTRLLDSLPVTRASKVPKAAIGAAALLVVSMFVGWALSPLSPWAPSRTVESAKNENAVAQAAASRPSTTATDAANGGSAVDVDVGDGLVMDEVPADDLLDVELPTGGAKEGDRATAKGAWNTRLRDGRTTDGRPARAPRTVASASPNAASKASASEKEKPASPTVKMMTRMDGEGLLRVGASPDAQVRIPGSAWESTPFNRKVAAGRYRIELRAPGGKTGSCDVEVLADRRVILRYDFKSSTCEDNSF